MKIVMAASPMSPENSERRYWAVSVIRAFGVLQVIGTAVLSYFYLHPSSQLVLVTSANMTYDGSLLLSTVLSIIVGLLAGFIGSAVTFAVAMFLEDVHTIKGYLRDIHVTGQYYDE